ncbi:PilL N-terminal domain-containing protein [Pseudomonas fluorescens]|uniref:PilL N-terminal domain-containing protein n=1 Tax=Pseudomonas fluorescens TaxID=294 RepID=A0A944HGZ9_PSEFL|nr:PilL N-terminal domain-containing protein [Pseudomonas fluorescens]MBT2298198.1 PilL N-terminal domain-containing protein [Pseudomonas fluorescens]MBT2309679.1 PilL N-terminal domain-containing protein [Pseudomonas fluorescens]MBT2314842.1 PilL N-terminal domain-containing protein [Pseudomonas fluorescens]MBT2327748.1 PilL N-terminal domain-containing protein [Pseudomonas fluorescens]MBT2345495.1 PilL N-terminal domain-containing protein [Pseudomonas fluorescens]
MTRFFTPICLLGALSACTAQVPDTSPPKPSTESEMSRGPSKMGAGDDGHQTELRYGRYTLVSTAPTTEQRDLLAQTIDVNIPSNLNPSVQDALHYVLLRSGYSLCPDAAPMKVLFSQPLPAAHYRLGPIPLRDALQVLAGPAWQLTVDDINRSVCFEPHKADISARPVASTSSRQPEARS